MPVLDGYLYEPDVIATQIVFSLDIVTDFLVSHQTAPFIFAETVMRVNKVSKHLRSGQMAHFIPNNEIWMKNAHTVRSLMYKVSYPNRDLKVKRSLLN